MYSMPPYPYLATDYGTQLSLFTHHNWIGGFCICGAAAHAAIFLVRDYDPANNYNNLLDRMIRHRDAIISHLNWVCIFLGFHSFGLYIHNDTMSALGRPMDMFSDTAIQLQPVFAQWIQKTHSLAPNFTAPNAMAPTTPTWGGDVVAVGGKVAMMPIRLGTSDFMVYILGHVKFRKVLEKHPWMGLSAENKRSAPKQNKKNTVRSFGFSETRREIKSLKAKLSPAETSLPARVGGIKAPKELLNRLKPALNRFLTGKNRPLPVEKSQWLFSYRPLPAKAGPCRLKRANGSFPTGLCRQRRQRPAKAGGKKGRRPF